MDIQELKELREEVRARAIRYESRASLLFAEGQRLRKRAAVLSRYGETTPLCEILRNEAKAIHELSKQIKAEAEEERSILRKLSNKDIKRLAKIGGME